MGADDKGSLVLNSDLRLFACGEMNSFLPTFLFPNLANLVSTLTSPLEVSQAFSVFKLASLVFPDPALFQLKVYHYAAHFPPQFSII